MSPAGRFLEKNPETLLWSDIGDRKAIEKTSQALRDGAAELRKQLSADLHDPDFLSAVFDMDADIESSAKKKAKPAKVCSLSFRPAGRTLTAFSNSTYSFTGENSQERTPPYKIEP